MSLIASTSGQRNFSNNKIFNKASSSDSDTDIEEEKMPVLIDNSLKIWKHSLF
jgi:hypothetical protein